MHIERGVINRYSSCFPASLFLLLSTIEVSQELPTTGRQPGGNNSAPVFFPFGLTARLNIHRGTFCAQFTYWPLKTSFGPALLPVLAISGSRAGPGQPSAFLESLRSSALFAICLFYTSLSRNNGCLFLRKTKDLCLDTGGFSAAIGCHSCAVRHCRGRGVRVI